MLEKKRHHYVPATYLRRFSNGRELLAISRKNTPDTVNWSKPDEAALRRFYYSQPKPDGSTDNNALEDLFSTFESSWPHIADTLERRLPANGVLKDLLGFIGFQRVRVPCFRDSIEQSLERFARTKFNRLRQEGLLPELPAEFPNLMDSVQITIDPHQSIHAMVRLLSEFGTTMERFGYTVLHNETGVDLITSDNPVSYFDHADNSILPYPTTIGRTGELLFPVSPRTIIHGHTGDRPRYRRRGLKHLTIKNPDRIRQYNRIIAMFAYEALISTSALSVAFSGKFANFSPVLDPSFSGFDLENMQMPPFVFGLRRKLSKYKN